MRLASLRSLPAVVLLALPGLPAAADGLYLKLAAAETRVQPDRPVKVRLTGVVTRSFDLPAPEFLVDDGSGWKPQPAAAVKLIEASPARVSPDAPLRGSWEVVLPQAGKYRLKARYQLSDRVVQSNALTVEVRGEQKAEE
jgi:hypothetical protein